MAVTFWARRAEPADLDALIRLRTEAEVWLALAGIAQWTGDYYDYARDVLRDSVDRGAAWVLTDRDRVVATVTLNGPDMDFWSPGDDPDSGLYLGKMIVARSHAGRGLGEAMVNWASLRAARTGKRWLRLDTRRDNTALHDYYLGQGFTYLRTVDPSPRRRTESGALFQRPAGTITTTAGVVVLGPRAEGHPS